MRKTIFAVLAALTALALLAGCPAQESGNGAGDGATNGAASTTSDIESEPLTDAGSENESGDTGDSAEEDSETDASGGEEDSGGDAESDADGEDSEDGDSADEDSDSEADEAEEDGENGDENGDNAMNQTEETESENSESGNFRDLTPIEDVDSPALNEVEEVRFQTGEGEILIEVYPDAAPLAAERFTTLVEEGFYDDTPVFRVIEGFVAQFGINWREDYADWRENTIDDEPAKFRLERGTLSFAKTSRPDTASTQIFINLADNTQSLRPQGFTVFGQVVSGMDVVDSFNQVQIQNQRGLWQNGEQVISNLPEGEKPTMIETAELVEE